MEEDEEPEISEGENDGNFDGGVKEDHANVEVSSTDKDIAAEDIEETPEGDKKDVPEEPEEEVSREGETELDLLKTLTGM